MAGPGERRDSSGKLGISRISEGNFELVHPRCVLAMQLDFEEGIELWKSGDPEGARDALRYALEGCGDNLWAHVALGRIALEEFRDPALARGHFGYAVELVERALPRSFRGRLPRPLSGHRPYYDAAEGLARCYEAQGEPREAQRVRADADRLGSPRPKS